MITEAALTSLRVLTTLTPGGTSRVHLLDADLDTPSAALPYTSKTAGGLSLYLTAQNGTFEFALDTAGFDTLVIEAKAAASAKLTIEVRQ